MSTTGVKQAIRIATSNDPMSCNAGAHIDAGEAKAIVAAAVYGKDGKRKTPVTAGESKAIADLFERRLNRRPNAIYTMACPENPMSVTMEPAAVSTLRDFLLAQGRLSDKMIEHGTVDRLRETFVDLDTRGLLDWQGRLPVGVRFMQVELMRERHPDGFTYTAFIPVGPVRRGALADPNTATSFFVARSGGFAGITQYAGPLSLKGAGQSGQVAA